MALAIVGIALLAAACASDGDPATAALTTAGTTPGTTATTSPATTTSPPASASAPDLDGTTWNVINYQFSGGLTNVRANTEITMAFAGGTVSGSTGCNEYTADYLVSGEYDPFDEGVRDENDGQEIVFEVVSVTERGCEPSLVMEQESDFLAALEGSARWLLARGQLILRTSEGFLQIEADPAA